MRSKSVDGAYDARDHTSMYTICNFYSDEVLILWTQVPLNGLRADRVCLSCGWTGQYPLYFGRGLSRSKLSVNGLLDSERGSGGRG